MDSYLATRTNRTFGLKGGRKLTACACGAGPSALIMSFCRAFSFLYGVQVLGHREADPATIFLQTDLALRAKVAQKWSLGKGWDPSDSETFPDMNGKLCHLCGMPLPERSDRNYVQRTDCGNHSVFEHPEVWYKPIFQFNKEDTRSPKFHPGGELAILNMQKTWKIGRVKFYRT